MLGIEQVMEALDALRTITPDSPSPDHFPHDRASLESGNAALWAMLNRFRRPDGRRCDCVTDGAVVVAVVFRQVTNELGQLRQRHAILGLVVPLLVRAVLFADGFTLMPGLVFIRSKYRGDVALLAHEGVHEKQMQKDGVLVFWVRYLLSKKYRLAYEVEAYKKSVELDAKNLPVYAMLLSGKYGLDVSYEEARLLIST